MWSENEYSETVVKENLKNLSGVLNESGVLMKKLKKARLKEVSINELIIEITEIKSIAKKGRWDDNDKNVLKAFAYREEYLYVL